MKTAADRADNRQQTANNRQQTASNWIAKQGTVHSLVDGPKSG